MRGVARLAMKMVDHFEDFFPEANINRDHVLAGALCHDIGKPWEFDAANRKRWTDDPARAGLPSLRHPIYGAYICLLVGLPEEVAHIVAGHSPEGDNVKRSLACSFVYQADLAWWDLAAECGLVEEDTIDH